MKLLQLKNIVILLFIFYLGILNSVAQTNYIFSNSGDWDNPGNWSGGNYPGTTININDVVVIVGQVTIPSSLNIVNNGRFSSLNKLTNNGVFTNFGAITNNFLFTNNGSLVNNGTFEITSNGSLVNSSTGIINNTNTFNNYKTLTNNNIFDNSGTLINNPGGTLTTTNRLSNFFSLTNSGTLNVDGILTSVNELINNGTLNIINFGSLDNSGILDNLGIITNARNIFNSNTINNSGTIVNNYSYNDIGTATLNHTGTLSGNNFNHSGNFSNNGILNPSSISSVIGTYNFSDNYIHNNSTLNIELESSSSLDNVTVIGTANLSGVLTVSLLNSFSPSLGNTFTILTAGSISGTFTTTNLPAGYTWNITYTATEVILEVAATLSAPYFNISSFTMFPNPSTNQFTIELKEGIQLEKVTIYNTLSQEVLTSENTVINTSNLASGSYFVEVITNKGKTTKKLIVD